MNQHMHRTQIYLTTAQYNFLQAQAERKDTSMASLIRELINNLLPKKKDFTDENILFNLDKKKFTMGRPDGSVNHDKYLYE